MQEGRPPAYFFEGQCPKPAYFFKNYAGPNLHTFGINYADFPQKYAEKPAYFFEGQCALRPWNHWVFGVPAYFRAFSLFLYYFEEEKKSNNTERMLAEKTRESMQRPDTCILLERNENMSRYELNIYEEPIYVLEYVEE